MYYTFQLRAGVMERPQDEFDLAPSAELPVRDKIAAEIHQAVEKVISQHAALDNHFLMGWILVSEWSDVHGKRVLGHHAAMGNNAEHPLPAWTARGYLSEGLRFIGPTQDAEEDDD